MTRITRMETIFHPQEFVLIRVIRGQKSVKLLREIGFLQRGIIEKRVRRESKPLTLTLSPFGRGEGIKNKTLNERV